MKRHFILLCLTAVLPLVQTAAQIQDRERITVIVSREAKTAADVALIQTWLEGRDTISNKSAYRLYLERKEGFTKILSEEKIPDSDVGFSSLRYSTQPPYRGEPPYYSVVQPIEIIFRDVSRLGDLVSKLISSDVKLMDITFQSSKAKEEESALTEQLIKEAKEKAQILAKASGRKLGKVLWISDTDEDDPRVKTYWDKWDVGMTAPKSTLNPYTLLRKSFKVTFELRD